MGKKSRRKCGVAQTERFQGNQEYKEVKITAQKEMTARQCKRTEEKSIIMATNFVAGGPTSRGAKFGFAKMITMLHST